MSEITSNLIRCEHCDHRFPSPIFFDDTESVATVGMDGNLTNCPACGKITSCNLENMRMRGPGAGFVGDKS